MHWCTKPSEPLISAAPRMLARDCGYVYVYCCVDKYLPTMEGVAFVHPKEKFSTVHSLFSDQNKTKKKTPRHVFVNSVHPSSATPLSHQLTPCQDGRICLRAVPDTPLSTRASSGSGSDVRPLGFPVKQKENTPDVTSIRDKPPSCTVVWRPL